MDINGTRFHLLLDDADWGRCLDAAGALQGRLGKAGCDLAWDQRKGALKLRPLLAFHRAPAGAPRLSPMDRRGTARDRYGNWFRIAEDGRGILAASPNGEWAPFWPIQREPWRPPENGAFAATPPAPEPQAPRLAGIAVTEDHMLVAGLLEPAGLLVFDLYAGGPPRWRLWPDGTSFEPFALAARPGGGLFVLDRAGGRLWQLDRRLDLPTTAQGPAPKADFQPLEGSPRPAAARFAPLNPLALLTSMAPPTPMDAVSVLALPDGSALLLEAQGADGFAALWRAVGGNLYGPASCNGMVARMAPEARESFSLIGHDMALLPERCIAITTRQGDQAFAFDLTLVGEAPALDPLPAQLPMRLFGGRALASTPEGAFYDTGSAGRMVPLVAQRRPRHAERAVIVTPPLDGRETGCIWHRLMLDLALPSGAGIQVESVAADDIAMLVPGATNAGQLDALRWQMEPAPYGRPEPERPFGDAAAAARHPTRETLFQTARGRWLRLRLTLVGDGRATPSLKALRAWYPRFSWSERYLPAVYREDATSAALLERWLANFEGLLTGIEERVAAAHLLLSTRTAPAEALDWLARFFGVLLDPRWDIARRRLFLRHAMKLFALRGTSRGVSLALHLALDAEVCDASFADLPAQADPIRIVERFRIRSAAEVELGLTTDAIRIPVASGPRWRVEDGAGALHAAWRAATGLGEAAVFPVTPPVDSAQRSVWTRFAKDRLGFVPGGDAPTWAAFLTRRRATLVALPNAVPESTTLLALWVLYQQAVVARRPLAHRFTVLLPVGLRETPEPERVAMAERIIELERPAHTAFDVRLFWDMLRIGEARLGFDTLLGEGSRAPALMPSVVLGRDALGAAHLAPSHPFNLPDRIILGRDRVAETATLGGP